MISWKRSGPVSKKKIKEKKIRETNKQEKKEASYKKQQELL